MIAVVQRVLEAAVHVEGELVGSIGPGLLALVAVCEGDAAVDVEWMARKLVGLRLFRAGDKHFDADVSQAGGAVLLVSNFTVAADTRRGRRPSFDPAADPHTAEPLFAALVHQVKSTGVPTATGRFRADMHVRLVNDGPVTVVLDSHAP